MFVEAQEVQLQDEEFLAQRHIKLSEEGELLPETAVSYAFPLALTPTTKLALKEKCIEHVKSIIQVPRNVGEHTYNEIWIVPWRLYRAIVAYRNITKVGSALVSPYKQG
jgi:hypothetical protein